MAHGIGNRGLGQGNCPTPSFSGWKWRRGQSDCAVRPMKGLVAAYAWQFAVAEVVSIVFPPKTGHERKFEDGRLGRRKRNQRILR